MRRLHENKAPERPLCFPSDIQWKAWWECNIMYFSPCRDCTPGYQKKMIAEGRCTNQDVQFFWRSIQGKNHEELIGATAKTCFDKPADPTQFEALVGYRRAA